MDDKAGALGPVERGGNILKLFLRLLSAIFQAVPGQVSRPYRAVAVEVDGDPACPGERVLLNACENLIVDSQYLCRLWFDGE